MIYLTFLVCLSYLILAYHFLGLGILLSIALIGLWYFYPLKVFVSNLILLVGFLLYFVYHFQQMELNDEQAPIQVNQVQVIPDTMSINGDRLTFQATADGWRYQAFYTLKSVEEKEYFSRLSQTVTLEVEGELSQASEKRNFSGFDYRAYLKNQGIYRILSIQSIKKMTITQKLSLLDYLHQWRRQAIVSIKQGFPAPMSHYMTGLLFGYLDKDFSEMSDLYQELGIIHLFALSGMQVGFFIHYFRKICLRLGLRQDWVDGLQLLFSFFYAGLTGFSISVIRSLIQAFLGRLGLKKLDNFALTLLICLLAMPNVLLTTAGVLSFTYAFIISMMDFSQLNQMRKKLAEVLTISLGSVPILLTYFSVFQPWSIVLTALLSFVFDQVILPLLSLAFIISPIYKLTWLNPLFVILENLLKGFGSWLTKPLILGSPSAWLLFVVLLILAFLYDYYRNKQFVIGFSIILALLFFLVKNPLENEVTMVNVGQGDSILIRDMSGKTILIDTGGYLTMTQKEEWKQGTKPADAQTSLIPYLKSRGIGRINQLIVTHTHEDHMGDLEMLTKELKVDQLLVSQGSLTKTSFRNRLGRLNSKIKTVSVGDKLPIMNSTLQVLAPLKQGDGGNDDSVVLYGRLLGLTFLFTGDLEETGEQELLATYPNLQVDVLKVGHHGSRGSSSSNFLDKVMPKIALISAGPNNRYQHPHQETLDRLNERAIKIYRTDQQGAIRFSGKNNWQLDTVR
ncbi:DNA internalization-related competence protein ComEC/Rec2 [Streptococcus sp. sy018]|uniref:DNA internalization-related competence protein ComEC/Rec2 n=1 Tax=Streptococcus sp. sy018 TaxID=2600147 RepID=UPI0011B45155|nr:DNA internalization-related competence protein ComEC/Rec2 [Streptococcus sp. sy018]TWS95466.1 DNA internalization-related competence protein ComEC/Rec2 [Streptococcus sp. sy018]